MNLKLSAAALPSILVAALLLLPLRPPALLGDAVVSAVAVSASAASAGEPELKPFVMPALSIPGELVDLRSVFPGPRGKDLPAVTVSGGHFSAAGRPVRFWGVNLVFGACFPPHDVADKLAARLAAFGVNCVRFHHMDNQEYPNGIWAKGFQGFSLEALDRLDYLLAALKKEGVYANINLHVSRDFSRTGGKMAAADLPTFGKEVDLFDPELIALQRDYARDLLGHVNAYTGLKYAEDPVTALVELTNEDSLFMAWHWGGSGDYSPRYDAELTGLWNDWLATKYKTDTALKSAWAVGEEPRGVQMLTPWESVWHVSAIMGAEARVALPKTGVSYQGGVPVPTTQMTYPSADWTYQGHQVVLDIGKVTDTTWHVQFTQSGVALQKGRTYTLTFVAWADKARAIASTVQQQNSPWRQVGAGRTFQLTTRPQSYTTTFTAEADEANTKVGFILGQDVGKVHLAGISLTPGGRLGLRPGESLAKRTVARMHPSDLATEARMADYFLFLADTERRYFSGMRDYLKKDLGVRAPITGTIGFDPLSTWVQAADMDFVDAHAYWQHPSFPHKSWDSRDWNIPNTAMVDDPRHSTLVQLAAGRMTYGSEKSSARPFTVTEYNHPAPSDYQAEGIPMIASFAAAQDWDGVFLFDYSGGGDWDHRDSIHGFFDIDCNPVKMAEMAAGALLFRRGDIAPLPVSVVTGLAPDRMAALMAHDGPRNQQVFADPLVGAPPAVRFFGRYAVAPFAVGGPMEQLRPATMIMEPNKGRLTLPPADSDKGPVDWKSADGKLHWTAGKDRGSGIFTAEGERSAAFVGFIGGQVVQVGPVELAVKTPKFAAVTVSSLDGQPLTESKRILIVAAGRTENTGQQWNDSRTSLGDQWGHGPTMIETVQAEIVLSQRDGMPFAGRLKSLDGEGRQTDERPRGFGGWVSKHAGQNGQFVTAYLTDEPQTIWYIMEAKEK